jgi:hypothetical protein
MLFRVGLLVKETQGSGDRRAGLAAPTATAQGKPARTPKSQSGIDPTASFLVLSRTMLQTHGLLV